MKTQSAKAKGRRLQKEIKELILEKFSSLEEDDVRSTSMGASGEDILLSPAARKLFPFSVECKAHEKLNIWSAIEQAEENASGYEQMQPNIHKCNPMQANASTMPANRSRRKQTYANASTCKFMQANASAT